MRVNLGGSNRKLARQLEALRAAGIDVRSHTRALGIHHSNHCAAIPDTPENRALLKAVGGTVSRRQ